MLRKTEPRENEEKCERAAARARDDWTFQQPQQAREEDNERFRKNI